MRNTVIIVPAKTCPIDQLVETQLQIGNAQVYFSQQCYDFLAGDCDRYDDIGFLEWKESTDDNGKVVPATRMQLAKIESGFYPTLYRLERIEASDINYECRTTDTFGAFLFTRENENIETK